jgi:hypothetical protein
MTEDEKRQQKAMLLLEHQEAEQHLAHLQAKAATVSARIQGVAEWLTRASRPGGMDSLGSEVYVSQISTRVDVLKDPQVAIAMDLNAAKKLIVEIKEARARVTELSERKQSLGLK